MTDEKKRKPRNRRGRRGQPASLRLHHDEVARAGDGTFSTMARVNLLGNWEGRIPSHAEFHLDGNTVGEAGVRDKAASIPLIDLRPESHHIVSVAAGGYYEEILLVVPALPKRKPAHRIVPHEQRIGEKHYVFFQVLDDEGGPVEGAVIRILDSTEGEGHRDLSETDAWGNAQDVIVLRPAEKERYIFFWVLGTNASGSTRIYGDRGGVS